MFPCDALADDASGAIDEQALKGHCCVGEGRGGYGGLGLGFIRVRVGLCITLIINFFELLDAKANEECCNNGA